MTFSAPATSLAVLAFLLAGQAQAQTAAPDQPVPAAPGQADAAATAGTPLSEQQTTTAAVPDDGGQGLQDIVVTATKRETNLQRTPIAISVVSTETLKDRHVQSLYDLADGGIPSLRVATFEARQSALTVGIRGIVPLDANQPAREQGVGIYIDGIYLGRQHGLNAALFDVERIEVLKGPQGTLFGRNTEGGALSIVTKTPSGEFGGRVNGSYGNYGAYNGEAHIDLPSVANFAFKVDGVIQHQDATTKNPLAGQTGWNYYDRKGLRAAVRWSPFDGLTDDFSYDVAKDKNSPFYSQLLNYNPNGCPSGGTNAAPIPASTAPGCRLPGTAFTGYSGTVRPLLPGVVINGDTRQRVADIGVPQRPSVDKTHGFTNILKYRVSPEIELRSLTAWRGVDATQWDNSGGAHRVPVVNYLATTATGTPVCTATAPCGFSRYSLADLRQRQFSQEFQAVGSVGSVDYVAGLYYFNEHVSDDAATPNSNGAVAIVNGSGQITGANYVTIPFCTGQTVATTTAFIGSAAAGCSIDRASEVWSKSYAAYGRVTWNATDVLHLTVGGRYTHDKKRGVLHISRNLNYDVNTAAAATNLYQPLDKSWDRFNPTATVAYDFSDTVHGYATYSTGYRSGGASSRTSNYQAFNPEDVKNYELGLKTDFWNHRGRFNLAGYIMDRKGSQVDLSTIQPTATGNFNNLVTFNAPGVTKIRGIEADLTLQPVDHLTLSASYAYTYTKIPPISVTYTAPGAVFAPATTPTAAQSTTVDQQFYIVFTPRNAASGSIDYEVPFGGGDTAVRFHVDGNYAQATQAFDQFATKADASFIVNGRVSLTNIALGGGGQQVTLSLWGRNLFDKQYVYRRDPSNSLAAVQTSQVAGVPNIVAIGNVGNVLGDYGNFNAPRTYGVEATLRF